MYCLSLVLYLVHCINVEHEKVGGLYAFSVACLGANKSFRELSVTVTALEVVVSSDNSGRPADASPTRYCTCNCTVPSAGFTTQCFSEEMTEVQQRRNALEIIVDNLRYHRLG